MHSVGEYVKQIRISKGITQTALADSIGSTKGAISRFEQGKRAFRFEQIQGIADFLGVSVFEIYGFPSENQKELEHLQKYLNTLREQIQRNSGDYPNEVLLGIDDFLRSQAEETEKKLQSTISVATLTHRTQVAETLMTHPDGPKRPVVPTQIDPATKVRNKRVDNLVSMFTSYPSDTQSRVLDVVAAFGQLNSIGQKHAVGRIKELTELPRYQLRQENDDDT